MKIIIKEEYCKGCDLCIELCPMKVFEKSNIPSSRGYFIPIPKHVEKCTALKLSKIKDACRYCEKICPDFAIEIDTKDC